jgi:hypothetical protein
MNIPNYGLLSPKPSDPAGYVTKDEMWAAVPFGNKFMILHNGEQIHVCQNLSSAKSYINKQLKVSKIKPGTSSLEAFL